MSRRDVDELKAIMALLWRSKTGRGATLQRGPKPRLDVDEVIDASIAIADAEPVGGVSMRKVADRLGVTPMAIYGYVPGKDALLALMYDAIHEELGQRRAIGGDWRRHVVVWAEDLLDLYVRHPWALGVSYARPVLGPHEQRVLERLVDVLRTTGLRPGLLRRIVSTLFHMVRGTAATIAEARQAIARSGIDEREWWTGASDALLHVVPDFGDRFPSAVWLQSDPADTGDGEGDTYVERHTRAGFRGGLDVLLDGVEVTMGRSKASERRSDTE